MQLLCIRNRLGSVQSQARESVPDTVEEYLRGQKAARSCVQVFGMSALQCT